MEQVTTIEGIANNINNICMLVLRTLEGTGSGLAVLYRLGTNAKQRIQDLVANPVSEYERARERLIQAGRTVEILPAETETTKLTQTHGTKLESGPVALENQDLGIRIYIAPGSDFDRNRGCTVHRQLSDGTMETHSARLLRGSSETELELVLGQQLSAISESQIEQFISRLPNASPVDITISFYNEDDIWQRQLIQPFNLPGNRQILITQGQDTQDATIVFSPRLRHNEFYFLNQSGGSNNQVLRGFWKAGRYYRFEPDSPRINQRVHQLKDDDVVRTVYTTIINLEKLYGNTGLFAELLMDIFRERSSETRRRTYNLPQLSLRVTVDRGEGQGSNGYLLKLSEASMRLEHLQVRTNFFNATMQFDILRLPYDATEQEKLAFTLRFLTNQQPIEVHGPGLSMEANGLSSDVIDEVVSKGSLDKDEASLANSIINSIYNSIKTRAILVISAETDADKRTTRAVQSTILHSDVPPGLTMPDSIRSNTLIFYVGEFELERILEEHGRILSLGSDIRMAQVSPYESSLRSLDDKSPLGGIIGNLREPDNILWTLLHSLAEAQQPVT